MRRPIIDNPPLENLECGPLETQNGRKIEISKHYRHRGRPHCRDDRLPLGLAEITCAIFSLFARLGFVLGPLTIPSTLILHATGVLGRFLMPFPQTTPAVWTADDEDQEDCQDPVHARFPNGMSIDT